MKQHRFTAVFFTSAVCNLKCKYCYIDKNPALKTIDDILDESFNGDYYINLMKEMFEKNTLTRVETWGAEPYLGMHRIYYTLQKIIEYFPNFKYMHSSTNFVTDNWFTEFYGLMGVFNKYPNRQFEYQLQLSLDGIKEINDYGRGNGTTEKFIKHFDELIKTVGDNLPPNVYLNINIKPTLDNVTMRMLDTKEKIIKYYQFLESFATKINNLGYSNIYMGYTIPNTAVPSQHTKEDGIYFANLCKMCREIEEENKSEHYFKTYEVITPFLCNDCSKCQGYQMFGVTCGTGRHMIGLLPNNMVTTCHNGFIDMVQEYQKYAHSNKDRESTIDFTLFMQTQPSKFTFPKDKLGLYEEQIELYCTPQTTAQMQNMTALIMILAMNGQIDEKYINEKQAMDGAYFLLHHTAHCLKDNYGVTGSITLNPIGMVRLLLNGAKEYIENGQNQ